MKRAIPAVGYLRRSSGKQEKSIPEQKAELSKLAERNGYQVVEWFTDDGICGDSGTDARPGLAALLVAVEAGRAKVLLAWHTNRISREDPMDSVATYNRLRKAGASLLTCCEGAIDLADFSKQLLLFVNQKANNDYLIELSAKVVRGKIANAREGGWNGGSAIYGMDRALFDAADKLVRRLLPGEKSRISGGRTRLIPSTDKAKLAAVRHCFTRCDEADVSTRELARELAAKGYPSPRGKGWSHNTVRRILTTQAYIGAARWGATSWGRYYRAVGEDVTPIIRNEGGRTCKQEEEIITVADAHKCIVAPDLFARVNRKMVRQEKRRSGKRSEFPLSGLMFCAHCGEKMQGETGRGRDRHGKATYKYLRYVCGTYNRFGPPDGQQNTTCGRHAVDADRVRLWIAKRLQDVFLGPGRPELVAEAKRRLKAEAKGGGTDAKRLVSRLRELDQEVGRLVKAVRTLDAPELVQELADCRAERERLKAEAERAGRFTAAVDLDAEAERLADETWNLGQAFTDADPATLRELFKRAVSRVECHWDHVQERGRTRCVLVKGDVILRECDLFAVSGVMEGGFQPTVCGIPSPLRRVATIENIQASLRDAMSSRGSGPVG